MNSRFPITLRVLAVVLVSSATFAAVQAQDEVKRPPLLVPEVAETALQFVPPGWRAETYGPNEVDLNGDGRLDAALVISHGGTAEEPVVVKHVLVLALRGPDGKLHRSIVNDAVVLDGDEGGAFGDPLEDFSVEGGTVAITHYGGSRERWGYTHRYRYQNGQWMLISLGFGNTDTLDLEHFDDHDIDLTTGAATASEKGDYEGQPKKPEIGGAYYELEVLPVDIAPDIDGRMDNDEWPGYIVMLDEKQQVNRRRLFWGGRSDLSAQLRAVRFGKELFLSAQVTDNEVSAGDAVRLVTKRGLAVKPLASKLTPSGKGYLFEGRYSLEAIARLAMPGNKYAVESLQEHIDATERGGDLQGFELPVAVEITDVDRSAVPKLRGVLSTRLIGSPYNGAIRVFRKGTLVLVSDVKQ